MIKPALPENETERLAALRRYGILDTPPEVAFDELTALAALICGTPIALVTLVDEQRQWFKSKVGLDLDETSRDVAFCAHAIHGRDLFEVPDAATDARFADNPLVLDDPHIRFYAGAPILTPEGHGLGTLCVIDRVPRTLTGAQRSALEVLSRAVAAQLEARRGLAERDELLADFIRVRARLEEAQRMARVGHFELDAATGQASWSDELFAVLDRDPALGAPSLSEFLDSVHPDDRERLATIYRTALADGERHAFDYRSPGRDGAMRHLHAAIRRRDSGGRAVLVGTVADVTEQREAAETLRQFFRLTQDLLSIATFDGLYVDVNRAFSRVLGWDPEQVRGERYTAFVHPDDRDMALNEGAKLTVAGTVSALECRFLCRDGGHRWLRWNITADVDRKIFYAAGRDVTDERAERERLRRAALHDPLTGLANRTQFMLALERCLARTKHLPLTQLAVIFLDLDGFKQANDTFGHAAGDAILFEVGRRLRDTVRPGDPIARLGGDEFAIILDGLQPEEPVERIAVRVLEALTQPYTVSHPPSLIGASLGIATSSKGDDPAKLIAAADAAMYEAKKAGGRRFVFATRG